MTYRHHGHYEGDPAAYRDEVETAAWLERDPLAVARRALEADGRAGGVETALAAAEAEMDAAVAAALAAAEPSPAGALEHVDG